MQIPPSQALIVHWGSHPFHMTCCPLIFPTKIRLSDQNNQYYLVTPSHLSSEGQSVISCVTKWVFHSHLQNADGLPLSVFALYDIKKYKIIYNLKK